LKIVYLISGFLFPLSALNNIMKDFVIHSLLDIEQAAEWILNNSENRRLFAFYGEMGAGKTTIIKAICEKLGSLDMVSSPTFSIINEYQTAKDELLYHFDFYRIEKREEVYEFGFEEYLDEGYYCFMEWPERIEEILKDEFVKVIISVKDNGQRLVQMDIIASALT